MKKTFTINISGSVFHIEEDAFEKLQDYLQLLKSFFETQKGGQEILQDIESRIAELLQEKINEGQEAVTNEWVDEVMNRMGKPEDFMDQEQTENAETLTKEATVEKTKKRMYRDSENRVLGGVCSGMSAYFNIDPVFLRILFVLLVFIGVGISAIVYLILWVVVPKARTTAQRLEMRGVDATISNIQKTVQEEVNEVKNSFSKINRSETVQKGKEFANKAGQATVQVAKGFGRVVAVIFGSLFILTGFLGLVTAMASLAIGGSVFHSSVSGMNSGIDLNGLLGYVVSPGLVSVSILLMVLLIGIPLLAILFVGTKMVFRYQTNNKLIGLGAFGIWLVALVAMIAVTAGQVNNFSQKNTVSSAKTLNCQTVKTLRLELGTSAESIENDSDVRIEDFALIKNNGANVLAGNPSLRIESTTATDFSVVISKQARGRNAAEVQNNLNLIQYDFTSKDSTLLLNRFFTIGNQVKWRKQEVQITLKVPVGKQIYLGKDLDQLHCDFNNVNNIWTKEMTGKTWEMTSEGLSMKE
jgi:phage shock protein PspC (stress-responsive transcriptional regulator)